MGKYDELVERLQRFSTRPIAHDAPAINRIAMDQAATAITTLEAELAAMKARGDRLAEERALADRQLYTRDKFIVDQGLWDAFLSTLPAANQHHGGNNADT